MSWLSNIGAIVQLILELMRAFKKHEVQALGDDLKNAKTVDEKRAAAQRIAAHFYNR